MMDLAQFGNVSPKLARWAKRSSSVETLKSPY